jgi:hypothetical protein
MNEGRTTMLCRIARWAVSRSEDRAARLPHWAERHLARCRPCREYARFTASLRARLSAEKDAFLRDVPEFPVDAQSWGQVEADRKDSVRPFRRPVLRPWPAAAAGFAVLAAALVLWQFVLKGPGPSPEDRAAALAALKSVVTAADEFPGLVTEAESSLERERQILERSVASAAEYLQARLNIRIVRREAAKSS